MEELLAKAIRDYPPGTEFYSAYSGDIGISEGVPMLRDDEKIVCNTNKGGTMFIHYRKKWAEIISLPHPKIYELW